MALRVKSADELQTSRTPGIPPRRRSTRRSGGAARGEFAHGSARPRHRGGRRGRGAAALAGAHLGEATALVHAGRTIPLIGRWAVQPPDRAVVATWEALKGEASTRRLIVAGDKGWTEKDGAAHAHAGGDAGPRARPVLHLLGAAAGPLARAGRQAVLGAGRHPGLAPGLRAVRSGRPYVKAYFDPSDGRPGHLRLRVTDPGSGRQVVEDVWSTGLIEGGGIRWPRDLRLTWDGVPYFAMTLVSFTPRPRLDDPPAGPP